MCAAFLSVEYLDVFLFRDLCLIYCIGCVLGMCVYVCGVYGFYMMCICVYVHCFNDEYMVGCCMYGVRCTSIVIVVNVGVDLCVICCVGKV